MKKQPALFGSVLNKRPVSVKRVIPAIQKPKENKVQDVRPMKNETK